MADVNLLNELSREVALPAGELQKVLRDVRGCNLVAFMPSLICDNWARLTVEAKLAALAVAADAEWQAIDVSDHE